MESDDLWTEVRFPGRQTLILVNVVEKIIAETSGSRSAANQDNTHTRACAHLHLNLNLNEQVVKWVRAPKDGCSVVIWINTSSKISLEWIFHAESIFLLCLGLRLNPNSVARSLWVWHILMIYEQLWPFKSQPHFIQSTPKSRLQWIKIFWIQRYLQILDVISGSWDLVNKSC